jgi:hypothetical protein
MYDYYLKQQKRSPRKEAKPNHHVFCFRIFLFCALVTSNIEKKKNIMEIVREMLQQYKENVLQNDLLFGPFFSRFGVVHVSEGQLRPCSCLHVFRVGG